MKQIVAVYKKKNLKTYWGFVFDTNIQMLVEQFMLKIHVSSSDYILWYADEKPKGVYTDVKVIPIYDENHNLINAEFVF